MHELVWFLGLMSLFTPFVLLAGHGTGKLKGQMTNRLNLVRSRSIADFPEGLEAKKQTIATGENNGRSAERIADRILGVIHFRSLAARANYKRSASIFLTCSICLAVVAGMGVYVTMRTPVAALLAGVLGGCTPVLLLGMVCKRRLQAFEKVLPQAVEMIARALRAGHSLSAAFSIVAEQGPSPAREEFVELFRKQKLGFPLREGLLDMLQRLPSQDLRVLIVGILVQRDTGGNLTVILDRTSSVIRERLKLQGDILVHTAQGRLTGWILCALPMLLFVALHIINPGYTQDLTGDPVGRRCLYGAVGLLICGACIIRKIVNGIEV